MKTKKYVSHWMRAVFAHNLRRALEERYPDSNNKPLAFQEESGISDSTIRRWLNQEVAPTFDQIEQAATALYLQPHQLLIDNANVGKRGVETKRRPPRRPGPTPRGKPFTDSLRRAE